MAFRANEVIIENRLNAERYLLSNLSDLSKEQRQESRDYLEKLMDDMGPVITAYPIWHPLIIDKRKFVFHRNPSRETGYSKIDHNVFFTNGFITCPYNLASNNGQDVIDAINKLPVIKGVCFTAEILPVKLYHSDTTAILVKCEWANAYNDDGSIDIAAITPKLMSTALEMYNHGVKSFTIDEMMDDYLLGKPCGKRSSLFVKQDAGLKIRNIWNVCLDSEMV